MQFVNYENHNIAYDAEGKGNTILFLHGFCADHSIWRDYKKDLLDEDYQVVSIDLPGAGASDVIPDLTIDQIAHAVDTVVTELKISKFILIGHSMGGYAALAYAQHYGHKLQGLGLFHSHPYQDTPATKEKRQKSIDFMERQGSALYVKQLIPQLFVEGFLRMNAYTVDRLVHKASGFPYQGLIEAQKAMMTRDDHTQTLQNIACPVLFIIGAKETVIDKDWSMKQVMLPHITQVEILDKVNHMGMLSAPSTSQLAIRKFAHFCQL